MSNAHSLIKVDKQKRASVQTSRATPLGSFQTENESKEYKLFSNSRKKAAALCHELVEHHHANYLNSHPVEPHCTSPFLCTSAHEQVQNTSFFSQKKRDVSEFYYHIIRDHSQSLLF